MEKLAVGLWLLVFGLWSLAVGLWLFGLWSLAFGLWLAFWDLKISNLKIIGLQIFKSTNFQIINSTLWVLGDG